MFYIDRQIEINVNQKRTLTTDNGLPKPAYIRRLPSIWIRPSAPGLQILIAMFRRLVRTEMCVENVGGCVQKMSATSISVFS